MNNIFSRIREFIKYSGISNNEFGRKIGCSSAQITQMLTHEKNFGIDKALNIISTFPILSPEWLLTGTGPMLRNGAAPAAVPATADPSKRKLIPFYGAEAEAGTIQLSNMTPVSEPDEWIDAGDWFRDADSAMRVHGDSMSPEYKSGSIIVMREVIDKRLVVYGEDYMVQTSEYRVIKRLYKGNEGWWIGCSLNEEVWEKGPMAGKLIHEPFDIFIDDVNKLCRVLGCVKRNESSRIVYARRL